MLYRTIEVIKTFLAILALITIAIISIPYHIYGVIKYILTGKSIWSDNCE